MTQRLRDAWHFLRRKVCARKEKSTGCRRSGSSTVVRQVARGAVLGIYGEQVLPRIIDFACGLKANQPQRERTCAGLYGDVVEIGFGSGHNVPFYPDAVTSVAAVEPADLGWKLAGK